MNKTPLFAILALALGLAGAPAFATPVSGSAYGDRAALSATHHGSPAAGAILAQNEEKPNSDTGGGSDDSNNDN